MNPKLKKTMTPYGYLMPTLALMMILLVIPIIMVIRYSLYDNVIANKNPVFVGLANYKTVLTDSAFWTAVGHTMFFVIVSIIAHMIIGMIFALILNTRYLHDRTKGIFRAVYALPWMFTASVIAITWRMVL
ncbi:MAG: sugar ABC transporter permease, partial [Solobacterium sp.]|nr:sugar ABC transporter permease [Solobacterium sp.]